MLGMLLHNWELKAASLGLAVTFWFFVLNAERSQVTLPAAVEYVGLGRHLVLVGDRPESVDVELHGPGAALARVTPSELRVRVSLADAREGETVLQLSPDLIRVPAGVAVARLSPARIRVDVAGAATQPAAVVPQIRGTPAAGYVINKVSVEPQHVEMKAARASLPPEPMLQTVPVDVSGSRQSVTQTVGLVVPEWAQLTKQQTVDVTVEIEAEEAMQGKKGATR
jgi:YbbR domain-containing protein